MKVAKQTRTGGFTLVELIVVIAILGILAGVGTVAYTGYIKAANKGVDQQLVGDIAYAIQLADYANPGMLDGGGMVILTDTDVPQVVLDGTNDALFKDSLEDAIPDLDNARLKYDWGVNISTTQGILASLGEGGTGLSTVMAATTADGKAATVSYADNAAFMWTEVIRAGQFVEENSSKTAGEAVVQVANGSTLKSASEIANYWDQSGLYENITSGTNTPDAGLAGFGAQTARNYAFAEYLKTNYSDKIDADTIKMFQNWENSTGMDNGNGEQLGDFVGNVLLAKEAYSDPEYDCSSPQELLKSIYSKENLDYIAEFDEDTLNTMYEAAIAYTSPVYSNGNAEESYSQAYLDGLAYYTLMQNVKNVSGTGEGQYDPTSSSYFDDLSGYVDVAGQICSGKVDTAALNAALTNAGSATNVVILLASKSGNVVTISVSPREAWVGGKS